MEENWMNHPAMKTIDERKRNILEELVKASRNLPKDKNSSGKMGKGSMAAMSLLIQTQKKMHEQGLEFTDEERELLILILTENMSPEEKEKVEQMRKIAGRFHGK